MDGGKAAGEYVEIATLYLGTSSSNKIWRFPFSIMFAIGAYGTLVNDTTYGPRLADGTQGRRDSPNWFFSEFGKKCQQESNN